MTFIRIRALLSAVGLTLGTLSVRAAFEDPLWSARSAALGGAFTTVGDDPTAAFYNPAAAASVRPRGANFGYAQLFTGVDEVDLSMNQLAYVHPLPAKTIMALGWGSVVAGSLRREDTVVLSAAQRYDDVPGVGSFSAGLSLRYLSQKYTLDSRSASDPVFKDGAGQDAVAIDLHAHLPNMDFLLPGLSAGLSLRSLNQPNVGLGETQRLPFEAALGARYDWKNWSTPLDFVFREGTLTPQLGVEGRFVENRLAARLGTDTHQVGAGLGYRHAMGKTTHLSVDYTFMWPLEVESTSGSHRATIGLEF
ncbi:MAG: hypothetical protein IPP35_08940 [Elusimicrobia bacterium]|nr:hypothetical protein [Elusimicrobiota bacterium]